MRVRSANPSIYPTTSFPRLRVPIPLYEACVQAGFPSPAEGYLQRPIDLNELLVRNPPSTFMVRAEGESMIHAPIQSGDLLIVDRSLEGQDGDIVLAVIDGEFTVKRLRKTKARAWLQPENPAFPDIELTEDRDAVLWGVVTGSVRQFSRHVRPG